MPYIRESLTDRVGTIAFDREAKRNALNEAFIAELVGALGRFEANTTHAVVLKTVSKSKVWSAGHDIAELPKRDFDPLPYSDPLEQLLRAVAAFPAPVIAMVQGSVWGGACDLVMACDLVYCDDSATFAITPAKMGLPYTASGLQNFMNRVPLAIAREMFFTADPISAERALRAGIVNELLPAEALEGIVYGKARLIADRSHDAIRASKRAIQALAESAALSPQQFEYLHGLRREVYQGPEYHEGIEAFMQKRKPDFIGCLREADDQ